MAYSTLSYEVAANGVAHVVIDVSGHKHNVITPELHAEVGQVARQLAEDDRAVGAVLSSGKSSFMAGGDLKRIAAYYDQDRSAQRAYDESRPFTESLRALEACGKPVAVAINGTALGGGLELALSCHYRVCLNDENIQLGFPEVTLGLIPGAGGTQRLPRMIGIRRGADLILSGSRLGPAEALELGIVDELASADDLLAAAENWVLSNPEASQPWDRRGFRVPGGSGISDPRVGGVFIQLTARLSAEHRHNYPAPIAALRAIFNGTTVQSMDQALKVETREFSALTRDPVARNIIRTLFINRGARARLDDQEKQAAKDSQEAVAALCRDAFDAEKQKMVAEGVSAQRIANAGYVVGMGDAAESPDDEPRQGADINELGRRLLCAQALAAAEAWARNELDPVDADLGSVLKAGFPGYTGGVMSYIDTMGLKTFIEVCGDLSPSEQLRARAGEQDRIYPSAA